MRFFDLGNDLMGSVRMPANYCGLVGYVPTSGIIPRTGILPRHATSESVRQLLRVGVLARTVEDAALVAPLLAGPDGSDTSAVPVADAFWRSRQAASPRASFSLLACPDGGGIPTCRATQSVFAALLGAL